MTDYDCLKNIIVCESIRSDVSHHDCVYREHRFAEDYADNEAHGDKSVYLKATVARTVHTVKVQGETEERKCYQRILSTPDGSFIECFHPNNKLFKDFFATLYQGHLLTLNEVINAVQGNEKLPKKSVIISKNITVRTRRVKEHFNAYIQQKGYYHGPPRISREGGKYRCVIDVSDTKSDKTPDWMSQRDITKSDLWVVIPDGRVVRGEQLWGDDIAGAKKYCLHYCYWDGFLHWYPVADETIVLKKGINAEFKRVLAEYVFHPDRVNRMTESYRKEGDDGYMWSEEF